MLRNEYLFFTRHLDSSYSVLVAGDAGWCTNDDYEFGVCARENLNTVDEMCWWYLELNIYEKIGISALFSGSLSSSSFVLYLVFKMKIMWCFLKDNCTSGLLLVVYNFFSIEKHYHCQIGGYISLFLNFKSNNHIKFYVNGLLK